MNTSLQHPGGQTLSTRKLFFPAFASTLLALCMAISCTSTPKKSPFNGYGRQYPPDDLHWRYFELPPTNDVYWVMHSPSNIAARAAAQERQKQADIERGRMYAEAAKRAAEFKAKQEAERERYNRREHVPELLRKYADAPAAWRAALAEAWVVPGMPREMVAETLLGAGLEAEKTTVAGHTEYWRWRAWRLVIENGRLAEIGRR